MSSVNMAIVIGHLGQDPELKYTNSGIPVTTFSLATTRTWKNEGGEKQEKTTWHGIRAWKKLAEIICEYACKGTLAYVDGEIEKEEYEGKDGNKVQKTYIVARNFRILGKGREKKSSGSGHPPANDDLILEP